MGSSLGRGRLGFPHDFQAALLAIPALQLKHLGNLGLPLPGAENSLAPPRNMLKVPKQEEVEES